MEAPLKQKWEPQTFEAVVENAYTENARGHDEIHQGYLNFGLWEHGVSQYVTAAENLVHRLGSWLELRPGHRLLDVACGMGTQDLYLNRKFGPLEIDALDVTWTHVEEGRRRAMKHGLEDSLRFHHGTAVHLPFKDATFTHALSIEGPIHFDTRERFFGEVRRVLKPGGGFALADYVLKRAPANRFERWVLDATTSLWKIPRANVWTSRKYFAKLEKHAFVDIHIEEVGDLTIPGYYYEQRRPTFRMHKIRTQGLMTGGLGFVIDIAAYRAYRLGLIDYILVSARKSSLQMRRDMIRPRLLRAGD